MNIHQIADGTVGFEQQLSDQLLRRGLLDGEALERAIRIRDESGERLLSVLTTLGLVSESNLTEAIAELLDLPVLDSAKIPDFPLYKDRLSVRFLTDALVLPIAEEGSDVVLAMADPTDVFAKEAIRLATNRNPRCCVAKPAELEVAIRRLYAGDDPAPNGLVESVGVGGDDSVELDIERLKDLASDAPVVRYVNDLIAKAVDLRASDIHIEPFEDRIVVRHRIDGMLREVEPPPRRFTAAIVSRIKIVAKLNIAERRLPQDGRIKLAVRGAPIDLRVATAPTMHGEQVVLRILDRSRVSLDFKFLGIDGSNLQRYLSILERPNGIILVTGPTGSGKTTTLYTSLLRLKSPEKKILTVEDPIEYQLDGVNQIQVKPGIGLDFANILRSLLRHDPDIIMVGEIRDSETAEIAVQAALTGHLVLSTLHTNDAAGTITRLLDMGVEEYLLTSTLSGIVSQRLVRTLCKQCREAYFALPELIDRLGLAAHANGERVELYRAVGCDECNGTGYMGRMALSEVLEVTDEIRRTVLQRPESSQLRRVAKKIGMHTMYDDGICKALAGHTTIEEVLRVTHDV